MNENIQNILLHLRCEKLKSLDFLGESDSYVEVYADSEHIGSTEVIKNKANPVYITPIRVRFFFETHQTMTFKVFDKDGKKSELIGEHTCSLSDIVVTGETSFDADLRLKRKITGSIHISPEEINVKEGETDYSLLPAISGLVIVESTNEKASEPLMRLKELVVSVKGIKIDGMDRGGKSDPYFVLEREIVGGDNQRLLLHKSKILKKTINPEWDSFLISTNKFVPIDAQLYVTVYNHEILTSDSLIGKGKCQMKFPKPELGLATKFSIPIKRKTKTEEKKSAGVIELSFRFYSPEIDDEHLIEKKKDFLKRQKKLTKIKKTKAVEGYHVVGRSDLVLKKSEYPKLSYPIKFVSLLQRGLRIQTHCALDFTESNLENHQINEKYLNPFEKCLSAVVPLLLKYDKDEKIPLYGYGGSLKEQNDKTPPFFHLNMQENPECEGLEGILDAYKGSLKKITLGDMGNATGGDTDWRANKGRYFRDDFYQVVNHICDICEKQLPSNLALPPDPYHILFFIIDGDSFDTVGTNRALIRASALPISIVLIGLGNTRFKNLAKFDADEQPLVQDNVSEVRDCCQFIKFKKCNTDKKLRKEVLAEIPLQVEQYFALYGVNMPNRL
ncbi:copine-8 [Anaeramoeba flamelloides]|uniref:Copine-8 n=1 Tax=Anaeramoeba flamelloides TaxID=1746091 RepID=A0AAV7YJA2_9EUKA|nr:copine-8 [Anaeramoeba flamelloides]